MNRIFVSLLTLALLGLCYGASLQTGEPHTHDEKNQTRPDPDHKHPHDHEDPKHEHEEEEHDEEHIHPNSTSEVAPGPVAAEIARVARELPRPGEEDTADRPKPEETGTKEKPRPGQPRPGDEDEEDTDTKRKPQPGSKPGGDNQDDEEEDRPRPGSAGTGGVSGQTGPKVVPKPIQGIQTLPAKIPEGFRPEKKEEEDESEE